MKASPRMSLSLTQSNRLLEAKTHKEILVFFERAAAERLGFVAFEACLTQLGYL